MLTPLSVVAKLREESFLYPCHHFYFFLGREKFFPAQVEIFLCPENKMSLG